MHIDGYSTFIGNSGANGIVSAGYSPMNFTGRNVFLQNNGTSLRVRDILLAVYLFVCTMPALHNMLRVIQYVSHLEQLSMVLIWMHIFALACFFSVS